MSQETPKAPEVPLEEKVKTAKYIIAHWNLFAPGKSGMYETCKELISYENRDPDVVALFINVNNDKGGDRDGELCSQPHSIAYNLATIHLVHYAETRFLSTLKPKVFFSHGIPEYCLRREVEKPETASFTGSIKAISLYDAFLVASKRHYYFWSKFDHAKEKVYYIPKGVDLEFYTPKGSKVGLEGQPSILYSEVWRGEKDPLLVYYALDEYFERNPKMRFYPLGLDSSPQIWEFFRATGGFYRFEGGSIYQSPEAMIWPANFYRGADMLISPVVTGEPSRVQMEAMGCGCPVIVWDSNPFEDNWANRKAKSFDPKDMADKIQDLWTEIMADPIGVRERTRRIAEEHYSMENMAKEVLKVLKKVQDSKV